ncbi:putative JHL07K02.14 protein [Quillaja saponaria]|uniref:JHL07K02.14 protein n=1 Tax=Quillaja saponaria TaxID=32244 RepID=A0AAD7KTL5_QUISA|nr:putative JHL07K02.14 protein [Quillaja saponaria]
MVNKLSSEKSSMELRSKLKRIISHHERMKSAFHDLRSHIRMGLLQAEEVFASLAIPLTNLVGMKTAEMAEEGRFSTIIIDPNLQFQECRSNNTPGSDSSAMSPSFVQGDNRTRHIANLEVEGYAAKVTTAGNRLREKQQMQLLELVNLLRIIETQVNSHHNEILQSLNDHRLSLRRFFQRAITYISTLNFTSNEDMYTVTQNILSVTFKAVSVVLSSVESGVEDLIQDLAEQICDPMVEYAKGLKADMTNGPCVQLVAMFDEMGRAMNERRVELEEVREKLRLAEERKIEALRMLTESEERMRKIKGYLEYHSGAKKGSTALKSVVSASHEKFYLDDNEMKDEKLLWELLRKKRLRQAPDSPLGPEELFFCKPTNNNKHHKAIWVTPHITHSPTVSNSHTQLLSSQILHLNSRTALGSF